MGSKRKIWVELRFPTFGRISTSLLLPFSWQFQQVSSIFWEVLQEITCFSLSRIVPAPVLKPSTLLVYDEAARRRFLRFVAQD